MKHMPLLFCVGLLLTACDRPLAPIPVSPPAKPPTFEIRDFKVDMQREEGVMNAKGRGTLVAKDPAMKTGTYVVWLTVKRTHRNDQDRRYSIVVRDGAGTIETQDHFLEQDEAAKSVRFYDWQVVGYVMLQPAVIEGSAASAPSK